MNAFTRSFFRCVFYLPVVTGSVAITVVWKWMLDPYNGILNKLIGTDGYNWLGEAPTASGLHHPILFTTSIGQPIVLYVAALGNVDNSIIEAAQVDGATKLQVFWKIKWPAIMPTTLYVLVITTINSFQCFALIQLMTKGGPMNATMTIMYQVYDSAYRLFDLGYANAIGVVLAIIIAIFSAIQFKWRRRTIERGGEQMNKTTDLTGTSTGYKVFAVIVLILVSIFFLFPLYWIATGSFKPIRRSRPGSPSGSPSSPPWTTMPACLSTRPSGGCSTSCSSPSPPWCSPASPPLWRGMPWPRSGSSAGLCCSPSSSAPWPCPSRSSSSP